VEDKGCWHDARRRPHDAHRCSHDAQRFSHDSQMLTWRYHDANRFSHNAHMTLKKRSHLLTWRSHGAHIMVSWRSHDAHMTLTWLLPDTFHEIFILFVLIVKCSNDCSNILKDTFNTKICENIESSSMSFTLTCQGRSEKYSKKITLQILIQ